MYAKAKKYFIHKYNKFTTSNNCAYSTFDFNIFTVMALKQNCNTQCCLFKNHPILLL